MTSDNTGKEYATKDIANIVDIASPTVRKYAQALEKAGYTFIKNEKGTRFFTDKDIFAFNEMKNISKKNGMPVERIAEMIVFNNRQSIQHEAFNDTVEIIQTGSGNTGDMMPYDTRYNELMNKLSKLDMLDDMAKELQELRAENKVLAEQMKQQQEYIKESVERRSRELVSSLRDSMQQRKIESAENENKNIKKLENIEQQLSKIQQNESVKDLAGKVAELNNQIGQVQRMIKETATAQEKKGLFARLFGK